MNPLPTLLRIVLLAGGLPLLSLAAPGPAPAGVIVHRDFAYDAHPRQKLDLYLPIGRLTQPRPLIIYLHGGGWRQGSKDDGRPLALRFVAQGYAVACVDYRLSGDAGYPAQLEDAKAAVRWLRGSAERYGLDRDHFGILGVAAGGHLAALLGAMNSCRLYESGAALDQPSRVQAVVDCSGPVDLLQLFDDAQRRGTPVAGEIVQLLGGEPRQVPVPAGASNPIQFADVETPPFLIIHGDQDPAVPLGQSRLLYDALVAKGLCAHLHIIHGAGHGGPAFTAPGVNALVDEFFAQTLKKGGQPPELEPAAITESRAAQE